MTVSAPDHFRRVALLFQEAVTLPPGPEREACLDLRCGVDTTLREEVARLLASDEQVRQRPSSAPSRLPRFGIYQARELIGAGGMGAVYLATREDGEVRQRVAVKAIASPYHSPLLESRLRSERQILAELYHPNIAAFLGGGITDDGFSYLVMEYVEGERIDSWCDSRRLSVRRRLSLFLKVCAAVSFAHQRLIVHRDLKPANVLVTPEGEPKLLDFGIARTLAADGGNTQTTSSLFLTPLYASPEVLRNQPVSVAADVYSLGVLLYQLLNGSCPFEGHGATPAEIVQLVLSSDAPPPLRVGVSKESAMARGQTPAGLVRLLRGDLESIVARALARSPADRYASVEQFADDVLRYMDGHPVEASSVGRFYRARKFVSRHKSAVASGTLVTLSLVAGLLATLWQARVAERRFADAHDLARYLQFDLRKAVAKLPGSTPVEADMARHSLEYLDRLSAEKIHDPVLRTEVGEGYADLGAVLGSPFQPNLGEIAKSRESFRKAIAILDPLASADPNNLRARIILARARLELGRSIGFGGGASEGLTLVKQAARDFDSLASRWPSDFEVRNQAAIAFQSLGAELSANNGYVNAQNLDAALRAFRKAIDNATVAAQLRPQTDVLIALASCYKHMGDLTELRDRPAATGLFRQALGVLDRIPAKDRDTPQSRNARSSALLGLGWNLGNLGDFTLSLAALDEAREIRDRASAEDPENVMALYFRTIPYRDLGIISGSAGHPDAKLRYFLIVIGIDDRLLARNPANRTYRFGQAELQADAANLSLAAGRTADAMRLARAGITTLREIALQPQAAPVEMAIAARALLETKVPKMADAKVGLVLARRAAALDPRDSEVQEILGEACWLNGDRQAAVQSIEQALALIEPAPTPARKALEKTLARYRSSP
jgi:eukaryotic-like serine/threonine-protein kinase